MELIATAESMGQAQKLLEAGVNTLYIGEDEFGLRLPTSFSREEQKELVHLAHHTGCKVIVAVNALMHNDRIKTVVPYLQFLHDIQVDTITVGDPGVIHLLKKHQIDIPFIYDAQTMVTSANQVNFWAKRGAIGAVLARELTKEELLLISKQAIVPVEVLVYGATCIHQSKRPLVQNYFNYVGESNTTNERSLFLAEPKKEETHYSIYEDRNGTHIFATNDVNLSEQLDILARAGITQWKLDGLFTKGDRFVELVKLFSEARNTLNTDNWSSEYASDITKRVQLLHPAERSLDEGFFVKNPEDIQ
ncbi:peptidase U32 family protein [Sporosarcina obsidiansis]|uniref:peptidase U32 family protein n=1 Tax=Sporosarcina obsidiansis TaxID=2660748 RepID=UPI002ED1681C